MAALRHPCHTTCLLNTMNPYRLYLQVTLIPLSTSSTPCILAIQSHGDQVQCRIEIQFPARTLQCLCNRRSPPTPTPNPDTTIRCPLCLIVIRDHLTPVNIRMEPMWALSI